MDDKPDVVVAGLICLDIFPDLEDVEPVPAESFYTPGKLQNTGPAVLSPGGVVANTGLSLINLDVSTALMGKVGRDDLGRLVLNILQERKGDCSRMIEDPEAATSYSVIFSPPGLDRMIFHCPGVNETFHAGEIDFDLVSRARLFHFGYPPEMRRICENSGRELVEIFRRVKELGVTTSLDMSLPDPASAGGRQDWRAILEGVLPWVDLFLPSAEETLFMLDRRRFDDYRRKAHGDMPALFTGDDLHGFGEQLTAMGAAIVAIKCGRRGIFVRTGDREVPDDQRRSRPADRQSWRSRELWIPSFQVDGSFGTTGCGDAANAGFLAAFLKGLGIEEAVRFAAAAGASSLSGHDSSSSLVSWEKLAAAVQEGWKTNTLEVTGDGWRSDGSLWIGPSDSSTDR